jgi:osmotically-inducible protein OsmY
MSTERSAVLTSLLLVGSVLRAAVRRLGPVTVALGALLAGRLTAEDAAVVDLRYTVLARQALDEDKDLAALDLGVRVRNRVATLWGPVPTAELERRAVARLTRIAELAGVRSEMHVDPEAVPSKRGLPARPEAPLANGPRSVPPSRGVLMKTPGKPAVAAEPAAQKTPAKAPGVDGLSQPSSVKLLTPTSTAAIEAAVRQLQQGERFRRIRFQVREGQVHLSGVVHRWQDLHELSRAIGRIPGVQRVILHDVQTDPSGR